MTQGVNRGMRMPTTADLMSMWNASGLKEKLIFTFLMLVLFRLGIHMPLYGINTDVLRIAGSNDILGFLDLFSGGALGKVSIFALGIGPLHHIFNYYAVDGGYCTGTGKTAKRRWGSWQT